MSDSTGNDQTVPVDPADIARVAALTAREQVDILSTVLGRPIGFVAVTPEQSARQAVEHGTPEGMAAALQNLNELVRRAREPDRAGRSGPWVSARRREPGAPD